MAKILIVDDEPRIRELIHEHLQYSGYICEEAGDGSAALAQLSGGGFDLVILDLMMPFMDGMTCLREMRARHINTPVIILTARGEEYDKLAGLESGADDYVVKPFSPRELVARVRAVLNRTMPRPTEAPDQRKSIPIEDIGFVVLEDQQTSITLPLLNALSDNNVAVILCGENRMPNALLMNLDSNRTQGEHYRMQIAASEPLKKGLWKQIVETKIRNQAALLRKLGYDGDKLKPCYMNVKSADADNREGIAARIYWSELFGAEFYRSREGSPPNNLLNYGYTILRAAVARAIMGSGLFPAFGIFHRNRYNSFPLADDVMEPYRPYVDELVYQLYRNGNTQLTKNVKGELLRLLFVDTRFDKVVRPLEVGLMFSASSLAKCFAGTQKKIAYPLLE